MQGIGNFLLENVCCLLGDGPSKDVTNRSTAGTSAGSCDWTFILLSSVSTVPGPRAETRVAAQRKPCLLSIGTELSNGSPRRSRKFGCSRSAPRQISPQWTGGRSKGRTLARPETGSLNVRLPDDVVAVLEPPALRLREQFVARDELHLIGPKPPVPSPAQSITCESDQREQGEQTRNA